MISFSELTQPILKPFEDFKSSQAELKFSLMSELLQWNFIVANQRIGSVKTVFSETSETGFRGPAGCSVDLF